MVENHAFRVFKQNIFVGPIWVHKPLECARKPPCIPHLEYFLKPTFSSMWPDMGYDGISFYQCHAGRREQGAGVSVGITGGASLDGGGDKSAGLSIPVTQFADGTDDSTQVTGQVNIEFSSTMIKLPKVSVRYNVLCKRP